MRSRRPLRLRGFSYRGIHRDFLTFCTFDRHPHFADGAIVAVALSQILRVAENEHFAILAYTFMPDHVHLLLEGMSLDADVRRFMAHVAGFVAGMGVVLVFRKKQPPTEWIY